MFTDIKTKRRKMCQIILLHTMRVQIFVLLSESLVIINEKIILCLLRLRLSHWTLMEFGKQIRAWEGRRLPLVAAKGLRRPECAQQAFEAQSLWTEDAGRSRARECASGGLELSSEIKKVSWDCLLDRLHYFYNNHITFVRRHTFVSI